MEAFVAGRWFALADLGCALLSGAIWLGRSQGLFLATLDRLAPNPGDDLGVFLLRGGWPLLIALFPWLVRSGAGRFPFKRTRFDHLLLIFMATACISVWAAYDREAAWMKFWVLLGGLFLFYALAGQPGENLWLVAGLLGLLGTALAGAFLLWQDFGEQYVDLSILQPVVQWWMSARPPVQTADLPPNIVGGLLALLAPFSVASGLASWRRRWIPGLLAAGLALVLIGFALGLTSSRGAWAALLVALVAWALWAFHRRFFFTYPPSQLLSGRLGQLVRLRTVLLGVLLLAAISIGLALTQPGLMLRLAERTPGLPTASSRFDLARNSLYLIADFPFTGGGLAAFAGLYSQYMMVIPFYLFGYSHNFFLDVALEQGIFGLLTLSAIFLGSVYLLIQRQGRPASGSLQSSDANRHPSGRPEAHNLFHFLYGGVLAGLIAAGVHGLIDDALYSGLGTPGVFLLPGIAVALSGVVCGNLANEGSNFSALKPKGRIITGSDARSQRSRREMLLLAVAAGLSILTLAAILWKPVLSGVYANLGAVRMARAELADFPLDNWDAERTQKVLDSSEVQSAVIDFNRSLELNPYQATARYRMGSISLGRGDFNNAVRHFEVAHQTLPGHRGVVKLLGYAYVWAGELDLALPLLDQIPEAQSEMEVYSWWWNERGRVDLANQSAQMAAFLENADSSQK